MKILDIKLTKLSYKYIYMIKLSNIKDDKLKSLGLPPDKLKNSDKHFVKDLSIDILDTLKISDIKKKVRHSLNFDRENKGVYVDLFLSIYGKPSLQDNKVSQQLKIIDSSLEEIIKYNHKYYEYQRHNSRILFSDIAFSLLEKDPKKFEKWKDTVSELIINTNKVHSLMAKVCNEKPFLSSDLEGYYQNEDSDPMDQAPIEEDDISDSLITFFGL